MANGEPGWWMDEVTEGEKSDISRSLHGLTWDLSKEMASRIAPGEQMFLPMDGSDVFSTMGTIMNELRGAMEKELQQTMTRQRNKDIAERFKLVLRDKLETLVNDGTIVRSYTSVREKSQGRFQIETVVQPQATVSGIDFTVECCLVPGKENGDKQEFG